MQEDWNFDNENNRAYQLIDRGSQKNDSIGNNSGGRRSQRDDDFDMMDDGYENKMQEKQNKQLQLKDEQRQQLMYGPSNKPQQQRNKHPQISVFDIQQHLSSKSVSILTYKKTLETILQFVNAFSLDQLKKFIRLILDIPGFDITFQSLQKKKQQRTKRKNKKMQMQQQEVNLLNNSNEEEQVFSDISAESFERYYNADQQENLLPSNGIQTILQILSFLTAMIDKCTTLQNVHLQQIIRQLLDTKSRFYNIPIKPQQLIQQISQFIQNTIPQPKYQQTQQNIQNSYVGLFQFSDSVDQLKQIFYYLIAIRCLNNCFRKQSRQNRLSVKMKINCIRVLSQLQNGSQKYFNQFNIVKQLTQYIIPKQQLTKLSKQQLQDYSTIIFTHSHKSQHKLAQYIHPIIQQLISQQSSIDKKCMGFKLIDKLILNTKLYPLTVKGCLQFLQQNQLLKRFMNDSTHSQLLRRLPSVVKFLYEMGKIRIQQIKGLIQSVMKSHQQFYRVVLSLIQYLTIQDLQQVFIYIKQQLIRKDQWINDLLNTHLSGTLMSIVSNTNLNMLSKRHNRKINNLNGNNNNHIKNYTNNNSNNNRKQQQSKSNINNISQYETQLSSNNNNNHQQYNQHPIVYQLFTFLLNLLVQPQLQPIYTPIFCKHIQRQLPLLLPLLQQQLTNKLSAPKHYQPHIISILQFILKLDIDTLYSDFFAQKKKIIQQKQQTIKYQFINNLVVNCNLYDSIVYILCKKRYQKSITQKCLSILILATKSYKPLQKTHIQLLWKILGLHSTNQFQKQQFFQFIKQLIKNSINLTQQSVKHIYFEIILKLHYDWFTPKIYDCFQMLFMRLNQDGKLLTYQSGNNNNNVIGNNSNPIYHLIQTQLVGLQKFYYLYFWSQPKVSKKVKDFLYKLYNNYKSSPQIKQKLAYQIIHTIMSYLLRNPQSQDHILHAKQNKSYQQHQIRGFQLLLKFLDAKLYNNQDNNNTQQSMIMVTIHNATRQALPPIKQSLQVNRNMLLKQFKQLIRKQINPPINQIQLINKGKPLRTQRMSLKQLKIQTKNTILVQNMDLPPQRKQSEQLKLKQSKQTLQLVFSQQYPVQLLDYIAQKYLGEQLQKICEWIMDQQKMKEIESQYKQKKLNKLQQQREIIIPPKKKYSTDSNQFLTFGQILSKQVQLLLHLIPVMGTNTSECQQQRKTIVEKQWQLIKKVPVNVQLARRVSSQLQKQFIDYERIFKHQNKQINNIKVNNNAQQQQQQHNKQLNYQAYLWYILIKLIKNKPDEYKNKLVSDKGLQLFIIQQLQRLICSQTYNHQLYYQLIQAHQCIIQNINTSKRDNNNLQNTSLFALLKQSPFSNNNKQKQSASSDSIIEQVIKIIGRHNNNKQSKMVQQQQQFTQSQTVLFSNLYKAQSSLIRMISTINIDPLIVQKLLSFLLYDTIQQQSSPSSKLTIKQSINSQQQQQQSSLLRILSLNKQQINKLLIKYKQSFLKYYFSIIIIVKTNWTQLIKDYLQLRELTIIQQNQQQQLQSQAQLQQQQQHNNHNINKQTKQWLYLLLVGYIQLIHITGVNQLITNTNIINLLQQDLKYFIKLLTKCYSSIQRNQLIGLLAIINQLLHILLAKQSLINDRYHQQQNNQQHLQIQQHNQSTTNNHNPIQQQTLILLQHLIQFLTTQFIYHIKGVPILTQHTIKQLYYQLLHNLSLISHQLLIKITQKIIKIDVMKRNHDHDNIEFKKNQFVGIQNLGCTCYINSLTQQLYHTQLPYKLLSLNQQQGLFELNHTFMQLYMSTKNAINIRPMIQQVKFYGQQIIPNIQQDVQQFLMSLLDYIQSCNGKHIIDSIFGGSFSQQLTYFSSNQQGKTYKKHKQQHFYNITLDIKNKRTLNQALSYFFRSQQLDDKIYCQQLDQKTTVIKRSFIKHFPKILIFTLKRFQFDMQNMVRNKLNDYLEFPMELNLDCFSLRKFIQQQQQDEIKRKMMEIQDNYNGDDENNNNDDNEDNNNVRVLNNGNNNNNNNGNNNNNNMTSNNQVLNSHSLSQQSNNYQLCGILIHSGSAQTGHYYSYIKRDNKWYQFNDRIVTQINLLQKIKGECFGGGQAKSRNAYMLFYQKVENNNDYLKRNQQKQIDKNILSKNNIVRDQNNGLEKMEIQENNINEKQHRMIDQQQSQQHHLSRNNQQNHQQHINNNPQQRQQQLEATLIIEDPQQQPLHHHGIFLNKVPQDNFFKILVKDENNLFIKQRLIYDLQYRKFVQSLTKKIKQQLNCENKNNLSMNKRIKLILQQKLRKLQKINSIINPQQQKPIVHFATTQLMQIEQIKQSQYEQSKKAKYKRENDVFQDLIQGKQQDNEFGDYMIHQH